MSKNTTEEYQAYVNELERMPPKVIVPKALPEEKQKVFTELCNLQRDRRIGDYKSRLLWMKRWIANDFSMNKSNN